MPLDESERNEIGLEVVGIGAAIMALGNLIL